MSPSDADVLATFRARVNMSADELAAWLDARWPGRVTSLNWGPWKTDGMVSAEVERLMNSRGVTLIPFDRGVAALLDELDRGPWWPPASDPR